MSLLNTSSSSKIILIGDQGVGKTSIRRRYFGKGFSNSYLPTLGADFAIKTLDDHILQIWDLAGQKAFEQVRQQYYNGAHGAILVFDLTDETSFENLDTWINELEARSGHMIPMIIVGNKYDLVLGKGIRIKMERVEKYIAKLQFNYHFKFTYLESSAKTGKNIDKIFATIIIEKESQKGIIIGKGGDSIKRIGKYAREKIEMLSGKKVYLELKVVVKKGWTKDKAFLQEIGYSS